LLDGIPVLVGLRDVPGQAAPLPFYHNQNVFMGHPIYGFRVLEAAIEDVRGRTGPVSVLVLGSGSGYEAVSLAKRFAHVNVDATDIVEDAVDFTKRNAKYHGVETRVHAFRSDLFDAVTSRYDLILFNAPRPIASEPGTQVKYQNTGFYDLGGRLLKRLFESLSSHLNANGKLLLMTDEKPKHPIPAGMGDRILSTDPWVEYDAKNGLFSIHEISHAGR